MSQDRPDRIDRIEAALELMQQQYENQIQVNATLRTELEVLKTATENLLRTVELHQDNIQIIAQAFRQHRSDGHGA